MDLRDSRTGNGPILGSFPPALSFTCWVSGCLPSECICPAASTRLCQHRPAQVVCTNSASMHQLGMHQHVCPLIAGSLQPSGKGRPPSHFSEDTQRWNITCSRSQGQERWWRFLFCHTGKTFHLHAVHGMKLSWTQPSCALG